jgi:hypothetical protein
MNASGGGMGGSGGSGGIDPSLGLPIHELELEF